MTESAECKTENKGRAAGLDAGRIEIVEQRMLVLNLTTPTAYLTTLPKDTMLYVLQGPARGSNLWWVQLSSGAWAGWAVQDEVAAFAVKPTP